MRSTLIVQYSNRTIKSPVTAFVMRDFLCAQARRGTNLHLALVIVYDMPALVIVTKFGKKRHGGHQCLNTFGN